MFIIRRELNHVKLDAQAYLFTTESCGDATRILDREVAWHLFA
jgi:hypothetical protein